VGVLKACRPRKDLLSGSINLEIFAASLGQVADFYKEGKKEGERACSLYTDADAFFSEGTHFTEDMKMILRDVFSRLSGDTTASTLKRLETGFGGGKTHTLIACLHLAKKGKELASYVSGFIEKDLLPEPGAVDVVAIVGDDVPIKKTQGTELKPYPLWAEIARQLGGTDLSDVASYLDRLDSPDKAFFERLFGGRKVLILIDELAHYATRWAFAYPQAKPMLSTFFMSLLEYASRHPSIAIVVTLAGLDDALSAQTAELSNIFSNTSSEFSSQALDSGQILALQQDATRDLTSILARRESVVVPVKAGDLSAVLGKRLFEHIDREEAIRTVEAYRELYERSASLFSGSLQIESFLEDMRMTYPFHPSMLRLLNEKLSTVPTFQKTRGVLRILTLAVRALWRSGNDVPMIHPGHLDFIDARTVDELLGRTNNTSMIPVLNADIGTADTPALQGGRSNAERADQENPHPDRIPYHVLTWRTVFLNSLAGQAEGLASPVFGIGELDALLAVAQPGLTPAQVKQALEDIRTKAFYLREKDGRYYAVSEPNVNLALSRIRESIAEEQILTELEAKARNLFGKSRQGFWVRTDVTAPQDLPDKQDRSLLGVLSIRLAEVDPAAFITTAGKGVPRLYQNSVFLFIPETARILHPSEERRLIPEGEEHRERAKLELYILARNVLATRILKDNPQNYGIPVSQVKEIDFPKLDNDLERRVSLAYRFLAYPVKEGIFALKEIRTAGGEGGDAQFEQIRTVLKENGEIIPSGPVTKEILHELQSLFFADGDHLSLGRIREKFHVNRGWPVLEDPECLPLIVREGVKRGFWCLVGKFDEKTGEPGKFYGAETPEIPIDEELRDEDILVTVQGARERRWGGQSGPTKEEIRCLVESATEEKKVLNVAQIQEHVKGLRDDAPEETINETLVDLARKGELFAYEGDPEQSEEPSKLLFGAEAVRMTPTPDLVVITRGEAVRRGWLAEKSNSLMLSGPEGLTVFSSGFLKKLGSFYIRGAKTHFKRFEVIEFELPAGGRFSLMLEDVPPEGMKRLGELFEILGDMLIPSSESELVVEIENPDETCPVVRELRRALQGKE
jgi:hypothetical protein